MNRISEGWWLMLVLCIACGLWLLVLPLLGYGFLWDGVWLRPAWLGLPPFVFGIVYAARSTRFSRATGLVAGIGLFALTYAAGLQFAVMRASHAVPCEVHEQPQSCLAMEHFESEREEWRPLHAASDLRSPLNPRTFVEVVR